MIGRCTRCKRNRVSLCARRICVRCAWGEYVAQMGIPEADIERIRAAYTRAWDAVVAYNQARRAVSAR